VIDRLNLISEDFAKEIGCLQFFTIKDLQNLGVFGTKYAARRALKNGQLSYIRISDRRRVVPRSVLLEYLRNNISNKGECVENEKH
jgi:hypothetical protein